MHGSEYIKYYYLRGSENIIYQLLCGFEGYYIFNFARIITY